MDYVSASERPGVEDLYNTSDEEIEVNHDEITSREKDMDEYQDEIASKEDKENGRFRSNDQQMEQGDRAWGENRPQSVQHDGGRSGSNHKRGGRRDTGTFKKIARKTTKKDRASHARMLRRFGKIQGVPIGATWRTRKECYHAGVHRSPQAGIQGSKISGACSIVLSGQYDDDQDLGDMILYVGSGGGIYNDGWPKRPGPQVSDQEWKGWGNEALHKSCYTGKPVRVVRSSKIVSDFAPYNGYRYDGLYIVTHAHREKDEAGHLYICRYIMERIPGQPPLPRRRRVGYDIESSRSSPASVVTSDTVVLPSETSTAHERNACFGSHPLIEKYIKHVIGNELAFDSDEE
ncbi:PUA-like domain-containing protein [Suillus bovinus]|uniref:PUA-like domain-containing protein n=1 Tax=Suillus bovinus TaxID=48563 RepID=UPI001B8613C4|nr:PUA-like domain-containing protein [Suillus bovinus]KAG2157920.1 PUA-like domain-containing protein [Suillus bovinus]